MENQKQEPSVSKANDNRTLAEILVVEFEPVTIRRPMALFKGMLKLSPNVTDTSIGIICLTKDNRTKPWILFEAGALAKGLSSSRV